MPTVHVTNMSHGPRGFCEEGIFTPKVLEMGQGGEFNVGEGVLKLIQAAHERGEVAMVNLSHRLHSMQSSGRLYTQDEMDAEIRRVMVRADPGAAGRAVAEANGTSTTQPARPATHEERLTGDPPAPDGPVDVSLLDDDQLRMLIEEGTGKAPHAQLGRKKLEEQAAPFLTKEA